MRTLIYLILFGVMALASNGILAARTSSTREHTETYRQWKEGNFHFNFFLTDTFLQEHRCTALSEDGTERRKQYLKLLQDNDIPCSGDWCIDDKFKCQRGNSQSCYNLEHIIDISNSMLEHQNKNIVGNIIMAYGKWNQQVGQLVWQNVEIEKREIYGNDIVNRAMLNIQYCHELHPTSVDTDDDMEDDSMPTEDEDLDDVDIDESSSTSTSTIVGYIFGGLVLVGLIVGITMAWKYGKIAAVGSRAIPPEEESEEFNDTASDIGDVIVSPLPDHLREGLLGTYDETSDTF